MHLQSPDKRPTEYGQNLKEFVQRENFMIAASTPQIEIREILAVYFLFLSLSLYVI